MLQILNTHATAIRMWGLPGATMDAPIPELRNGAITWAATGRQTVPCPSFLIEHRRGLVLFDTGLNPCTVEAVDPTLDALVQSWQAEFNRQFSFTREDAVDAQIRKIGFAPSKVRYVVPSHLHFDHAGGVHLFPDATILVGKGELANAYSPPPSHRRSFLLADLLPTRSFEWVELAGDLDLFGDGSIVILWTPGHTPGELSMIVRLPSRTIVLTGDTCHFCIELEHGMASADIPCSDAEAATRSIQRIRMLRRTLSAEVWIGHDPMHWSEFPHSPESVS